MGIERRLSLGLTIAAVLAIFAGAALAADEDSYRPEDAVAAATASVSPSVVAIETRFKEPQVKDDYFYWAALRGARPLYGLWGSGFIYKDPRYVITTDFLLSDAAYVRVILPDGRSYKAEIVGSNEDLDVAVLKVDWGPNMTPVAPRFGNSDKLRLGQPMAIVGKSLNSVDTFATAGIISAIRKQLPDQTEPTDEFLQFDAAFELSYVGAPIVDVFGNVIGMVKGTSGIVAGTPESGTNINLGVPVNDLTTIADRIIGGNLKEIWFGVETQLVNESLKSNGFVPRTYDWDSDGKAEDLKFGMWVSFVEPNSPAEIAGLKSGDIIVNLDKELIKYEYDWNAALRNMRIGQLVTVKFLRKSPVTNLWEKQQTQVQILENPTAKDDAKKKAAGSPSYHGTHP
jgi:serine protease Do